jgi:hypothetical protein
MVIVPAIWLVAGPSMAASGEPRSCGRCNEFWVVDTRSAPVCCNLDRGVEQITYWKCEPPRGLVRKTFDEFVAAIEPSLTTTFYVHGNTVNRRMALKIAEKVMSGVGRDAPAYRMILWSWPSQHRLGWGPRNNVMYKARWSESQGYYLAWLVDKLNPRTTLTLVGHSFGARTVAAALHGLATNQVAGYDLGPRQAVDLRLMQAALVAPAMDNRWLWRGSRYGEALTQVDRLLVTRNPNDRLLRLYSDRFLPSGVRALGLTGIPNPEQGLGDLRFKLTPFPATWAGTAHRWSRYADAPEAAATLRDHFFYDRMFSAEEILGDPPPDDESEPAN